MTTPVKKLTIKTCGDFSAVRIRELLLALGPKDADGKQTAPPDGTTVELLKISGEATSAKTGQTDKGQYTKLGGNFLGQDLIDGELFSSKECILPEYIGSQLGEALMQAGENGAVVTFGFKVAAKQKASAVTGYEFKIISTTQTELTDAQKRLMTLGGMTAPVPKLAAPAEAPAAAPADAKPATKSAKGK